MMKTDIDRTVKKFNMLSNGDTVVVGVSGGADSMLLLHYLISVKKQYSLNLIVAHIEHGIRGKASIDDALFVKSFCLDNDIDFRLKSIDAVNESKCAGIGVEEYSRNVRYDFFNSIKCDKIATAHNKSDLCETALFRLARGTSLKGMCSIPPVRDKIIRPLIEIGADDIRKFCDKNDIEYRVDDTNTDNSYSRNYIRNVIIPNFNELNPSFENAVSRFVSNAVDDEFELNKIAADAYNKSVSESGISIVQIGGYSDSIIRRVIIKYFDSKQICLDNKHLDQIFALIFKGNGRVQIKSSVYAYAYNGHLFLKDVDKSDECKDVVFTVEGSVVDKSDFLNIRELSPNNVDFYCDYDRIVGNVSARSRISGDKIDIADRKCTKSLKKLFNEMKIPVEDRKKIAVLYDDLGVIGVVGYCCSKRVCVSDKTQRIYTVKIHSEDS